MTDDSTHRPLNRRVLIGLLLLTVAVRMAVILALPDGLRLDTDAYRAYAETLANTGVYGEAIPATGAESRVVPSAHRPPLYPLLLAVLIHRGSVLPAAVALMHMLLSVGTVWLSCLLARRWGLGSLWWLVGLLVACDPILVYQSAQMMNETLAVFLSALCLLLLTTIRGTRAWRSSALAGGSIALAALCRPAFLAWLPWVALSQLLLRGMAWRERIVRCLALVIAAAVVLAPWVARNTRQLGWPVIMTTHGGYTLLLGNNPDFYRYLKTGYLRSAWDSRDFERKWADATRDLRYDPVSLDRLAYRRAWQNMSAQPRMLWFSSCVRVARLWGMMPYARTADGGERGRLLRYGVAAWYAATWVLVGCGVAGLGCRCCHPPWLWGTTLCLALTLVHAVYWCDMRMRAPLVPVLGLLAARGAAELAVRLRRPNLLSRGDL